MEEIESANVSILSGIEGDARGKKRNRQITILFEDDWYDACKDIDKDLHWTKRRANLFVKGMRGPQKEGDIIEIGNIKLKVSFEPVMVIKMVKGGNDFPPIGNAFAALCRVSNNGSTLEYQHIDAGFCETLGCCTPCWTGPYDNDLTMLNLLDGHINTSCMPFFDNIRDDQHHRFGITVRERLQFRLGTFKVRSYQNLCITKTVRALKQGHEFVKIFI